jgi:hypothetical protein
MQTPKFELSYDRRAFSAWDYLALTACQSDNYGNQNNWFFSFRGGLHGFHARMAGAEQHYSAMHAWSPMPRNPVETEYHLAAFFFHADSAFECLVFALNALGFATKKTGFRDITDVKALRNVRPQDLLGKSANGVGSPLQGYIEVYPTTVQLCAKSRATLEVIFEQHDVSKHRHTIYQGGDMRMDAPPGFWDMLKVDETNRYRFWPVRTVILGKDIREPIDNRKTLSAEEVVYFEEVAERFFSFVSSLGAAILNDSESNINISKPLNP